MVRKKTRTVSPSQQRQRELAWLLYITQGYVANVDKALAVNAYTLDSYALKVMRKVAAAANEAATEIREELRREM